MCATLASVKPTAQHICGDCATVGQRDRDDVVVPLRNLYGVLGALEQAQGGGEESVALVERALHGARSKAAAHGGAVDAGELAWPAQQAVYASALPRWKGKVSAPAVRRVAFHVSALQAVGCALVGRHRKEAAPGHAFVRARRDNDGLLFVVLRAWRERAIAVGGGGGGAAGNSLHHLGQVRQVRRNSPRMHAASSSSSLSRPTCLEWVRVGEGPDVWGSDAGVDRATLLRMKTDANRRPSLEVRRWRLYEACKWVTTFGRLLKAHPARVRAGVRARGGVERPTRRAVLRLRFGCTVAE